MKIIALMGKILSAHIQANYTVGHKNTPKFFYHNFYNTYRF